MDDRLLNMSFASAFLMMSLSHSVVPADFTVSYDRKEKREEKKNRSLILSEKPSAAPEHPLLSFSQQGTGFAGQTVMKHIPIIPADNIAMKYERRFPPRQSCVQVCSVCNYPSLTRLSHTDMRTTFLF